MSALADAKRQLWQGPATPPPGESSLIVTAIASLDAKPVKYIVPGRIPAGKLILVGGRGGGGKSTVSRALAAAITSGRCAFGMTYPNPVRGSVLFLAGEDGPADTILPALLAEGASIDSIGMIDGVHQGGQTKDFCLLPEHVELVRKRLEKAPGVKLIIIDPIASFVGRAKIDDHRATELRQALDPLSALAEKSGVTVLMLAHLNKATGDAVDRIAGSAAYRDAVRAAYVVTEDPDDETRRLLTPVKENLPGFERTALPFGLVELSDAEAAAVMRSKQFRKLEGDDREAVRRQLRRVRFDPPVKADANGAVRAKKGNDPNKVARCVEWLKQFLAQYAYPSKEILDAARKASFTFDNLKEAKADLKSEGLHNSNMGRLQGEWWSGFGSPAGWSLRPEPTPHTPLSPSSPHSPHSPHTGGGSGERRETGDTRESGVGAPDPPDPADIAERYAIEHEDDACYPQP